MDDRPWHPIVGGSCSAHAEFWNGNDLKSKLESFERERKGRPRHGRNLAAGYVAGVYDAIEYSLFCLHSEWNYSWATCECRTEIHASEPGAS